MKITIESTDKIVELEIGGARVPARVWEGQTEAGVPVLAFITRISPQTHDREAHETFARKLSETRKPKMVPVAIDYRYVID
jgi:hypothetical protein